MKIHEYQAKQLFQRYGLPVPDGRECRTPDDAARAFQELKSPLCVVKAQIHAGGRGKAGGVKLVKSADEAREAAASLIGRKLVTHQTGPDGQVVRRLWIERGSAIKSEFYVGVAVDRELRSPVIMVSAEGGMDIEEVAARSPGSIRKAAFSPDRGLSQKDALPLARTLKVPPGLEPKTVQFLLGLTKLFVELDCQIAEINPLVQTKDNQLLALDAKIDFDPNAAFRHPELAALRDLDEEDAREIEASKHGLSYIALDGNIGCMVNGAGLAMATMDVIQLHGGQPANFLDVGGGASTESVTAAFKILLSDRDVEGVLINIFGGIMKCDVIATGVVQAVKEVALSVPLVVRLEGTNVEKGKEILARSGLPIVAAGDLDDAAAKICGAVAGGKR